MRRAPAGASVSPPSPRSMELDRRLDAPGHHNTRSSRGCEGAMPRGRPPVGGRVCRKVAFSRVWESIIGHTHASVTGCQDGPKADIVDVMSPPTPPVTRLDYGQYLLRSQRTDTLTNFADHRAQF